MNERKKLIEEIHKVWEKPGGILEFIDNMATFIISDRARIVAPLVKFVSNYPDWEEGFIVEADRAIDNTIKNAGIDLKDC